MYITEWENAVELAINQIQQLDEGCQNFDMVLSNELMKSKERTRKMEEGKVH